MIIQRCRTTGDYVAYQKINGRPHLAYAATLPGVLQELQILIQEGRGDDSRSEQLLPKAGRRALKRMVKVEKKG